MKYKFRLDVKLVRLLAVSMMAIALLLVVGSYSVHSRELDYLYKSNVSKVAKAAASLLDGDALKEMAQLVTTEEFIRFRKTLQEGEEERVAEWLREHHLYNDYQFMSDTLHRLETNLDLAYIYVQDVRGEFSNDLIPSIGIYYFGYVEENPPQFSAYSNEHIEPTISHTDYGWLSSGGEPVFDSDGNAVATACVDVDMTRVMMERFRFLGAMIVLSVLFILLCGVISVRQIRRMVVRPLSELSTGTKKYGEAMDETQLRERVIADSIHSGDEIEDLCQEIRGMQLRIIDYMDSLTHETAEKERIGAELNVATQIQENMLPRVFPAFPGRKEFDLYAAVTPAKEVSGDFYDFFLVDNDHLALVIADISDKGIPAGLLMVVTKTIFKNQALMGKPPAEVMREANRQLYENNGGDMFVKAWFGILELSTGTLRSANAGHRAPAYCPVGGSFDTLRDKKGIVLALIADTHYEETTLVMKPGSGLFLYTDGLLEAVSAQDEFFGVHRILETLNENTSARPTQVVRAVKKRVTGFVKDTPQPNDITMLSVTFSGADGAENGKRGVNPVKTSAL